MCLLHALLFSCCNGVTWQRLHKEGGKGCLTHSWGCSHHGREARAARTWGSFSCPAWSLEAEGNENSGSSSFLSIQYRASIHGKAPFTITVGFPTSVNPVKTISHKHVQRHLFCVSHSCSFASPLSLFFLPSLMLFKNDQIPLHFKSESKAESVHCWDWIMHIRLSSSMQLSFTVLDTSTIPRELFLVLLLLSPLLLLLLLCIY